MHPPGMFFFFSFFLIPDVNNSVKSWRKEKKVKFRSVSCAALLLLLSISLPDTGQISSGKERELFIFFCVCGAASGKPLHLRGDKAVSEVYIRLTKKKKKEKKEIGPDVLSITENLPDESRVGWWWGGGLVSATVCKKNPRNMA